MFSLHERTQRRVCQVAFIAVCVVPTVLAIGWVVYFHRPWQEHDWQRHLEESLHLRVEVAQVSAPRPGQRQFERVRLADLQSGAELATIDRVTLNRDQSLAMGRVELRAEQFFRLVTALEIYLAGSEYPASTWTAEVLVVRSSSGKSWELSNAQATGENGSQSNRRIEFQAQVAGNHPGERQSIRLGVERLANGNLQALLDTSQAKLPVWLLADVVPGAKSWAGAELVGELQLNSGVQGSSGVLRGRIAPIDTQVWIGADSPHRITAQAALQFETLEWAGSQIRQAQGTLEAEGGTLSHALLVSLEKNLHCTLGETFSKLTPNELVAFDRLGLRFYFGGSGLTVTGTCLTAGDSAPGCMVAAGGAALLNQPAYSNLPAPLFVQVFCPLEKNWLPESHEWLPASQQATRLFERLPNK